MFLKPQHKCAEVLQFSISTHPFSLSPLFRGYLNPQVSISKMISSVDYHPCPSRLASRIHPFIFYINSLWLYLSPEFLLNFLSNMYIPPCVGKSSKFMVFIFLENALNLGIFTHPPLPIQNSPLSYYQNTLGRRKLLIPSGSIFFENLFPQQQQGVESAFICSIRI